MARSEFAVHLLNDQGKQKATQLGEAFTTLLEKVEELSGPGGREMAIVRTKLEEASFFAKKAMAVRPENQLEDNPIGVGG